MNPTSKWERYPHRLLAACLILGLLVRLGMPGRRQFFLNDRFWPFALVAFGYCASIIYEHYLGYLRFGDIRPGLQFRYHFPVLFPFLYVFAFTVCGDNPKTFSRITLLIICLFSFANGFLFFKRHDSEDWYRRHQNSLRESSRAHLVPHSAVVQTNVFHRSQS